MLVILLLSLRRSHPESGVNQLVYIYYVIESHYFRLSFFLRCEKDLLWWEIRALVVSYS